MILETFVYHRDAKKWSVRALPVLDGDRTLVLVFGATEFLDDPSAIRELYQAYPRSHVVGCSSAGEITGSSVRDGSLSVAVAKFERTTLATASVEVSSAADSFGAGRTLAKKLDKPGLRGVLVLSEGLGVNGSQLVRGLNSVLPDSVVVTGGLSGDGTRFHRTWVCVGDKIQSGVVAAIGFYGDHVVIRHGSKGGWDKFGPERTVTRSEANILYAIDGRPALALYKEYLGDKASELPASALLFPLAMRATVRDEKVLVRTVLAVDHDKQSMTFAGDVPQGSLVQLMKANFDRLIEGASLAARSAADMRPGDASLAVAISCVGRRIVLGDRVEEEVEAVLDVLPKDAKMTGFYSYGEISPFAKGHCDLHNQTMTLTVFSESLTPVPKSEETPRATRPVAARVVAQPAGGMAEFEEVEIASDSSFKPTPGTGRGAGLRLETFSFAQDTGKWSVRMLPGIDSDRTLVLAFGATEFLDDPGAIRELRRAYPRSHMIGCSSAGEIAGTTVRDGTLSVAVAKFDRTTLATASVEVTSATESFSAGQALAKKLDKPGLRGVLVLSEGLGVNGSQLVSGLNSVLPDWVVVTGGLSGDSTRFQRTWVCVGDTVRSGIIAAVGFYGDHVVIRHGSKGGWDKFGPERTVTRSEGNVVHEIDGRPALALYKAYLGDKVAELPASALLFPLAMRAGAHDEKALVRTVLAVDHAQQSMTFAGDVPQGSLVQLMKANFDRLIEGASLAARSAAEADVPDGNGALAVAISCVGRRIVLGDRVEEEVEAVLDVLPKSAKITGFYSYGEISPFATGHCDLHNQTMTLTVFAESPTPQPRVDATWRPPPPPPPLPHEAEGPQPTIAVPANARRGASAASPGDAPAPASDPMPTAVDRLPDAARASRPAATRSVPPIGSGGRLTGLVYDKRKLGEFTVVRFAGRMTEAFKGAALGRELEGKVVLDLASVERITSFGVREWLEMLQTAQSRLRALYLARCSEPVINQVSMIRRFAGTGQIVSFFAPYCCEQCSNQFERLIDCMQDASALAEGKPPPAVCPRCEGPGAFDDDAQTYFGFAESHGASTFPPEVRSILLELEKSDDPIGGEAVEKIVDGRITRVKVASKLDASLRWNRVVDGLEGHIVFDLSSASGATPDGTARFEAALRGLEPLVESIRIEGCPRLLAERLANATWPARARIDSAIVEGRCGSCGALRSVVVNIQKNAEALRAGQDPRISCKRCNALLGFDGSRSLLYLLGAHAGHPAEPEQKPAVPEPPLTSARPIAAPARSEKAAYSSAFVALLGVVALVGIGVVLWQGARAKTVRPAPASAAAEPDRPRDAAPPVGWSTVSDLPPPWVERPFVIEGAEIFIVGRGGPVASEAAALELARTDALVRLADGILAELVTTPLHELVTARAAPAPELAQHEKLRRRLAERLLAQVGAVATPERADAVVRQRDGGVEAIARYRLSKQGFNQAVSSYRQTATFHGLVVARFYPELEASIATEGDLVIVGVERNRHNANSGIVAGDIVLAVNERPVFTVETFGRVAVDAWARTPPGGSMTLQVESRGTRRSVSFTKSKSSEGK